MKVVWKVVVFRLLVMICRCGVMVLIVFSVVISIIMV